MSGLLERYYVNCDRCGLPLGRAAMKARGYVAHFCDPGTLQEAQGCDNAPPQILTESPGLLLGDQERGDSRQTPTGSRRQDAEKRPGSSETGT